MNAAVVVAPALERREGVLLLLQADADVEAEIVARGVGEAGAAAVTVRVIVRDVRAGLVVHRAAAEQGLGPGIVERPDGADVDGAGDAAGDQVRGLRFVDVGAGDHFRRIDLPAHIAAGLRGSDFAAVDQAQHQSRPEAAHHGLALTLPRSRVPLMPGSRTSDSAMVTSGSAPMSPPETASTTSSEFFLTARLLCRLARYR